MAKQKPTPATHFVVSRVNWRVAGYDRAFARLPGETRVAAFGDFDAAEADRATREEAARKLVNPFRCGTVWADRSRLPEPVFRDFIKDAGLEPPAIVAPAFDPSSPRYLPGVRIKHLIDTQATEFPTWADWWDTTAPTLSAELVARVWEGLDRVRFFQAEERPVRAVAFAVVEISWNYNDEWFYPAAEGGAPHTAYRTRERADAECARMNAEARERWRSRLNLPAPGVVPDGVEHYAAFPFDMQDRPFPGDDPFAPRRQPPKRVLLDESDDDGDGNFAVDEVPFYEVIAFELPEEQ